MGIIAVVISISIIIIVLNCLLSSADKNIDFSVNSISQIPDRYRPHFVNGEWKSGWELVDFDSSRYELPVECKDYIDLFGEPYRWNPDKKELESVE